MTPEYLKLQDDISRMIVKDKKFEYSTEIFDNINKINEVFCQLEPTKNYKYIVLVTGINPIYENRTNGHRRFYGIYNTTTKAFTRIYINGTNFNANGCDFITVDDSNEDIINLHNFTQSSSYGSYSTTFNIKDVQFNLNTKIATTIYDKSEVSTGGYYISDYQSMLGHYYCRKNKRCYVQFKGYDTSSGQFIYTYVFQYNPANHTFGIASTVSSNVQGLISSTINGVEDINMSAETGSSYYIRTPSYPLENTDKTNIPIQIVTYANFANALNDYGGTIIYTIISNINNINVLGTAAFLKKIDNELYIFFILNNGTANYTSSAVNPFLSVKYNITDKTFTEVDHSSTFLNNPDKNYVSCIAKIDNESFYIRYANLSSIYKLSDHYVVNQN